MKYWMELTKPFNSIKTNVVEEMYKAKYLGYFPAKTRDGGWTADVAMDVFYQPNPDISQGHTNYFGLFQHPFSGNLMITNASPTFEKPMMGVISDDGEVVISRYRHDYRSAKDGSCFTDGGFDYIRSNRMSVPVTVDKDEFFVEIDGNLHPVELRVLDN